MLEAKQSTLEKPHTTQKAVQYEEREPKMSGPKDMTRVEYLAGGVSLFRQIISQEKKYIYSLNGGASNNPRADIKNFPCAFMPFKDNNE